MPTQRSALDLLRTWSGCEWCKSEPLPDLRSAKRGDALRRLTALRSQRQQSLRNVSDLVRRGVHGLSEGRSWLGDARDLPDVLRGRGFDLFAGRGGLEASKFGELGAWMAGRGLGTSGRCEWRTD